MGTQTTQWGNDMDQTWEEAYDEESKSDEEENEPKTTKARFLKASDTSVTYKRRSEGASSFGDVIKK